MLIATVAVSASRFRNVALRPALGHVVRVWM